MITSVLILILYTKSDFEYLRKSVIKINEIPHPLLLAKLRKILKKKTR